MHDDKSVKIKFYLRGLATGLVLGVVILGLAFGKQKAGGIEDAGNKEQNPVESSSEVDRSHANASTEDSSEPTEPSKSTEPSESTDPTEPSESTDPTEPSEFVDPTESSEVIEPSESTDVSEPDDSSTPSEVTGTIEPSQPTDEYVTITIQKGNSSWTVAKKLADAGLVESAKAYDAYLCHNGYDKKISVGVFEIKKGSSQEEIAKIITSGNKN